MSKEADQRLARALQNLRTETAFTDQLSNPESVAVRMNQTHTPGLGIAVIDDFEVTATASFGVCEAGKTQVINRESLFLAGSISKPVFAAAIMYLVQSGQLDLDEDINHYLSSWKVPANHGWQPRITLRQILSHTAGLTVHGFPGYQTNENIPTVQQILNGQPPSNTPKVEANMLPGIQFRYSGGGTTVAQLAMTDFLNDSFPKLMKKLVLDPLGMHSSSFENPLPMNASSNIAVAHPYKNIPLRGKDYVVMICSF